MIAGTDGSQTAHRLGASFVLWHPAHGTFYRHWFGVQVCASDSTDAGWLAKTALMLVLRKWPGTVLLATEFTASLMANLTRSPPAASLLSFLFRAAITQL